MHHPAQHRRRAFTLIELLVVMGIIIVLIGILLPVIASVRRASYATSSQSAIMNLNAACEQYRQDFNAYPGIFANSCFAGGSATASAIFTPPATVTGLPTGTATSTFTMTENMIVSLLGGVEPAATVGGTATYKYDQVGMGSLSHVQVLSARRRYPPYMDAVPGGNLQAYTTGTVWSATAMTVGVDGYDSNDLSTIPEPIDKFPDPLPILYLRANTAAAAASIGGLDNTYHWNSTHLYAYIRLNAKDSTRYFPGSSEDINNNGNTDGSEDLNGNNAVGSASEKDYTIATYFTAPGTSLPRQKGAFMLIGAGPDRRYGTRDDQTNFGGL